MQNLNFLKDLKKRLLLPLPGIPAQSKMQPPTRRFFTSIPESSTLSSVLVLLFPKNNEWHLVLIERTGKNHKDRHKGQISFPGGKHDTEDKDLLATALRETEEEIGINQQKIKIIGSLTGLYIHVSNFAVYPFIGYMNYAPEFFPQEDEVNEILEIPVTMFSNPANIKKKNMRVTKNITLTNIPYYDIFDKTIWGATAMILSEFMELIA